MSTVARNSGVSSTTSNPSSSTSTSSCFSKACSSTETTSVVTFLLDIGTQLSSEGAQRPTPRCLYIADFSTTTPTDRTICALSLAPSRAPHREATQPAPRVDPPGASVQRSKRGGEQPRREWQPPRLPWRRGHIGFNCVSPIGESTFTGHPLGWRIPAATTGTVVIADSL